MVPPDDSEPFTYRERALMDATARRVVDELSRAYPPEQYGAKGMQMTLKDFFGDMEPAEHKRQHGWVHDVMNGSVNRDMSWQAFWFDIGKSFAKLALGGLLMLLGLGLLDYIKAAIEVGTK